MIGTTLSHYKITAKLGQGGMGEVYRATDENLGRDVAIKVLPADVAGNAERLARFKREAHLLGSLNHTNIASIYGLEEADGKPFLVLELVEGEDLSERLSRGAIPIGEAVEIAKQIAEALEEAHERGIVHRDLKPANIKLKDDDAVRVLDFGLAKAYSGDTAEASSSDLTQSPTMSAQATQAGVILGTAGYMSPEQARGKTVDKRADIWAFGVVLFEMLAGGRLFEGETVSDTLASVLKEEPDWALLPRDTPRKLRKLLRHCLTRNLRQRIHDIGDARIELEELGSPGDEPGQPAPAEERSSTRERVAWGIAAIAVVVAVGLALRRPGGAAPRSDSMRLSISLEPSLGLAGGFDLSRDGAHVVFSGRVEDGTRLFVRDLNATAAVALPGTEDARGPLFSPDGEWIAFYDRDNRLLKKIARTGGPATVLAEADFRLSTATWSTDGSIQFTQVTHEPTTVFEVEAPGSEIVPLRSADPEQRFAFWPRRIPDTGFLLATLMGEVWRFEAASLGLQDMETGERRVLLEGAHRGRLLSNGQLVFARSGVILAAPFDTQTLTVTGPPQPIVDDALDQPVRGSPFSISEGGTIVYLRDQQLDLATHLTWVDRDGTWSRINTPPKGTFGDPRISPEGSQALVSGERDVWSLDLARGAPHSPELRSGRRRNRGVVAGRPMDRVGRKSDLDQEASASSSRGWERRDRVDLEQSAPLSSCLLVAGWRVDTGDRRRRRDVVGHHGLRPRDARGQTTDQNPLCGTQPAPLAGRPLDRLCLGRDRKL